MTIDGYNGYGGGIAYDSIDGINVDADYKPFTDEEIIDCLVIEAILGE
ncbi:hypothetical protein QUF55_06315 [Clostridiaceae bacterium HSG29]|nr:hypothetical protein [Clostridiaceae bacterium HSG29]